LKKYLAHTGHPSADVIGSLQLTNGVADDRANPIGRAAILWVMNNTVRRFLESATAPPIKEKIMTGKMRASPMPPNAMGFLFS